LAKRKPGEDIRKGGDSKSRKKNGRGGKPKGRLDDPPKVSVLINSGKA